MSVESPCNGIGIEQAERLRERGVVVPINGPKLDKTSRVQEGSAEVSGAGNRRQPRDAKLELEQRERVRHSRSAVASLS